MTGLIILAAGTSSRLGQPKQNLRYKGQTLLQGAAETALASGCKPVIIVLGANSEVIAPTISQIEIQVVLNPHWQLGMASSVKAGIAAMADHDDIDSVVIMLCDQPFVTPGLINLLLQHSTGTGKPVIACRYNNTIGVPALFSRSLFGKLAELQGDEGAKYILKNRPQDIHAVDFDRGSIDIDTAEDYEKLRGSDLF